MGFLASCHSNDDCSITEACIGGNCQPPCEVHNPCALNAVCVNANHGTDCSCADGFQGNGFVGCLPGSAWARGRGILPYCFQS